MNLRASFDLSRLMAERQVADMNIKRLESLISKVSVLEFLEKPVSVELTEEIKKLYSRVYGVNDE